jgi:hypothetical protein
VPYFGSDARAPSDRANRGRRDAAVARALARLAARRTGNTEESP